MTAQTQISTAVPKCPTCGAPGKLTELKTPGGKLIPNEVGFDCSKDPKHWEIYEVEGFK